MISRNEEKGSRLNALPQNTMAFRSFPNTAINHSLLERRVVLSITLVATPRPRYLGGTNRSANSEVRRPLRCTSAVIGKPA